MTRGPGDGAQDQWLARLRAADAYNGWIFGQIEAHLGADVLEVGCGAGAFTARLAARARQVHAIDIDAASVASVRRAVDLPNVQVEQADITRVNWSGRFDTVVMLDVLEHLEDDVAMATRLHQALAPGGRLIVKVPAMPSLHGAQDRAVGHYRRYTARGLEAVLKAADFADIQRWHFNVAGVAAWWLNGRLLRRAGPPSAQISIFETLVPVLRSLDVLTRFGIGLSLFAVAVKPR